MNRQAAGLSEVSYNEAKLFAHVMRMSFLRFCSSQRCEQGVSAQAQLGHLLQPLAIFLFGIRR